MPIRREYVSSLYRDLLGREGSAGEIEGHLNNPGGEEGLRQFFLGSPEYTSTHGGTQTWQDVGGQVQPYKAPSDNVTDSPETSNTGRTAVPTGSMASFIMPPSNAQTQAQTGLTNVYRNFLGRDPAPGDIEKWLSGQFGYGSGVGDYDKFVKAIMESPEARAYRPAAPSGSYKSLEYWQSQGVPPGDIFDAATGQLKPGWSRTANGYERATTATPYTGFTPKYDYSAFNTSRAQDPSTSAKDAFAWISNSAPPAPMHDKQALASWFKQYVQPHMDALGHKVTSVSADGFTYTNHEGTFFVDFVQNAGATPGSMPQRFQWNATPADDATRARYAGTGTGTGSGAGTSGTQRTTNNIGQLFSQLGQQYGGAGSPGIYQGPVQQAGQDPLSQLITGGLAHLITNEGMTSSGNDIMGRLKAVIDSGGYAPNEDARLRKFESARELMAKGERTATNDARAALADRGLLSTPGNVSGAEQSTIGRIQTRNAEEFARALRDIGIAEDDAAGTRLTTALGLATGMATDQARTLLATLGAGSDRQNMLSQIALESLQTNMAWNQFLATFGLERDKVMYEIQNGNIDGILPYLTLFLQLAQGTQRGYV